MPKKNSSIEVKVQKKLKDKNIKFKKHIHLIGRPDIFIEPNICIFCDGDYWHGNPLLYKPNDIINAGKRKIKVKNKWKYDKNITTILLKKGYKVLRFWETDINTNIDNVVNRIMVFK
jgi:G:T-mismatch repair DNA endonuclease (very short patch repair protein)